MTMLTGNDETVLTLESTETSATMITGHFLASSLKTNSTVDCTAAA